MSKRNLVFNAFNNKPVSRVPVGFWFHFTEENDFFDGLVNSSILDQNFAGHKKYYESFKPDFIKIMSDGFFKYPNEELVKIQKASDFWKIHSIGHDHEWIKKQVEHVKRLIKLFGHDIASFYNIFSPSKYLRLLYGDNGDEVLAEFIKEDKQAVKYVLGIIASDLSHLVKEIIRIGGADGIYFSVQSIQDSSVASDIYKEIIEPSELSVLASANSLSDNNILHICGYEGSRNDLSFFTHYEAKAINWAVHIENINLEEGKELFGGRAVIGGFDNRPEGVLYSGNRTEIEQTVEGILNNSGQAGIILGADCTLPGDIDLAKLEWVRQKASALSKKTIQVR